MEIDTEVCIARIYLGFFIISFSVVYLYGQVKVIIDLLNPYQFVVI